MKDATFPGSPKTEVVLPRGRLLSIRALQPGDEETVRAFCEDLSPRTRYWRFLSYLPRLSDAALRRLTCVDAPRTLAFIATVGEPGDGELIALGNLAAVDDRQMEVGLVVRDDWQRQRVGTVMVRHMQHAAHALGFDRFIANVSSDNVAIGAFLQRTGRIVSSTIYRGTKEITFVGLS